MQRLLSSESAALDMTDWRFSFDRLIDKWFAYATQIDIILLDTKAFISLV